MANNIELAKKFLPILDGIYKAEAITTCMDATSRTDFTGSNEIKVLKVTTTGLGDYSREDGYPKGDVLATWETMTLAQERGKEISVDRMDDEETLGMTFGMVTGEFMRLHVIPELDAYRFAKYASTPGINTVGVPAALTKSNIIAAIDEAVRVLDENEVPIAGRRLFVNSNLKATLNQALARTFGSDKAINTVLEGYNDMPITYVPAQRFCTEITLNDGSSTWGFEKAASAKDINFMVVYPPSVLQVVKLSLPKIFSPDENQLKDDWKFQFRAYHDAFVYENKVKGIYLHTA